MSDDAGLPVQLADIMGALFLSNACVQRPAQGSTKGMRVCVCMCAHVCVLQTLGLHQRPLVTRYKLHHLGDEADHAASPLRTYRCAMGVHDPHGDPLMSMCMPGIRLAQLAGCGLWILN